MVFAFHLRGTHALSPEPSRTSQETPAHISLTVFVADVKHLPAAISIPGPHPEAFPATEPEPPESTAGESGAVESSIAEPGTIGAGVAGSSHRDHDFCSIGGAGITDGITAGITGSSRRGRVFLGGGTGGVGLRVALAKQADRQEHRADHRLLR